MHIRSLRHILSIVKSMLKPERIVVLGSSSLLASAPTLGDPGQPLELSFDADLLVEPCDSNRADVIHEAIGQNSLFHRNYGVYADLMKPNITETFAPGWLKRCVRLEPGVLCLSPADLAFAKLRLGRNKDVRILRAILAFLKENNRPHWEAVVREQTAFLDSIRE